MGFLDALFGGNTSAAQDAATQTAIGNISNATNQSMGILHNMTNKANAALQTGASNATDALNSGYGAATGAVTNYGGQAQTALAGGAQQGASTILGGNAGYQPYSNTGILANMMQANSLGLNGASGNAAATSAFQASPGYQFQVDQATDAAARKAASLGIAGSGNTLDAITRLGSNLANTEYGNWQSNLSGLAGQGLTAATGMSGNNQAAGTIQNQAGTNSANLFQNTGNSLGTLNAAQGTGLAGIQSNLGSALSGNYTGLGQGLASTNLGSALQSANLSIADAQAQDTAANANNGIFSKILGGITGLPLGGATTGAAAPGSFTITPAAASSSPGGIFGSLLSKFGH